MRKLLLFLTLITTASAVAHNNNDRPISPETSLWLSVIEERCAHAVINDVKRMRLALSDFQLSQLADAFCRNSDVSNISHSYRFDDDHPFRTGDVLMIRPMLFLIREATKRERYLVTDFFETVLSPGKKLRKKYQEVINLNTRSGPFYLDPSKQQIVTLDIDEWIVKKTPEKEGMLRKWRERFLAKTETLLTVLVFAKHSAGEYRDQGFQEESEFLRGFSTTYLTNNIDRCKADLSLPPPTLSNESQSEEP